MNILPLAHGALYHESTKYVPENKYLPNLTGIKAIFRPSYLLQNCSGMEISPYLLETNWIYLLIFENALVSSFN